jgi:hypothetical protein
VQYSAVRVHSSENKGFCGGCTILSNLGRRGAVASEARIPTGSVDEQAVSAALDRILDSRPFRNSNQCSALLRYIVQHTLLGEENLLRERVIGAELFGRPADYETSEDPVVRLRVSEVRKRLAQYYLTEHDPRSVRIEIPSGSYRATFRTETPFVETAASVRANEHAGEPADARPRVASRLDETAAGMPVVSADAITPASSAPDTSKWSGRRPILAAVLVAACVLAAVFALVRGASPDRAFRTFWQPWLKSATPVILSVGSNAVYRFQYDYLNQYAEQHGLKGQGLEFYVPLAKDQTLAANDLYPAYQSFVALGDVAAVSRVVATLTEQKKTYQERFPNDVSFAELRGNPSVLVGGFNNAMTLELTKQLPFVMRGGNEILDTTNAKRAWRLNVPVPEPADYAIITRLVRRDGDASLMSIAGLGQYGTLAAAELVCSPAGIKSVADKLPRDWPEKNLQIVIRVNVVDFKASATEVVAFRSW